MDRETASGYASDGLLWLARNKNYLEAFLITSGTTIHDLRIRSNDTEFLVFVLDFLMTSDELICKLCSDLNIEPQTIQQAQYALFDQGIREWT